MTMKRCLVLALVVALSLGATPVIPPASAQSPADCDAAIQRLERDTQQLGKDLDADVKEFVKSDAAETALRGVRNHYKGKPTADAVFDLKDKWDSFNSYAEAIKNARVTMEDLARCINTRGCSLIEFAKRQNEVIAKWIEKLGDEGLTAAAERVNKAASVIRNYAERTLNTGIGGAIATAEKCNARIEQQANSNTTPVNQQAAGKPGGGSGKTVGLIVAAGGAVAGALYASKLAGDLGEELFAPTTPTTTTSGGTTTTGGGTSSSTVNYTAAVDTRTCTGNSTIEPCNSSPETTGTCNALSFTVSVSGGTVSSCRNWLSGTISGGTFNGNYNGSCGALPGPAVSGSIPGTVSGTSQCRGNQYTIRITVR